jgi:hypothetical protein
MSGTYALSSLILPNHFKALQAVRKSTAEISIQLLEKNNLETDSSCLVLQ